MKLEKQVCSFEFAVKLKELGVKQESYFWWLDDDGIELECMHPDIVNKKNCVAAFSVSELGEMFPISIDTKKDEPYNHYRFTMHKALIVPELYPLITETIYSINYYCDTISPIDEWFRRKLTNNIYDSNEANSRAKMLIHLIENEYVKVEDINK